MVLVFIHVHYTASSATSNRAACWERGNHCVNYLVKPSCLREAGQLFFCIFLERVCASRSWCQVKELCARPQSQDTCLLLPSLFLQYLVGAVHVSRHERFKEFSTLCFALFGSGSDGSVVRASAKEGLLRVLPSLNPSDVSAPSWRFVASWQEVPAIEWNNQFLSVQADGILSILNFKDDDPVSKDDFTASLKMNADILAVLAYARKSE